MVTTTLDDCTASPVADDGTCTDTSWLDDGGDGDDGRRTPCSTWN